MFSSDNLALVEEFFFVLSVPDSDELQSIQLTASVDLTEFAFTEEEIKKLKRLAQKLELALLSEFTQHWSVASVIVELRNSSDLDSTD